MFEFVWWLLIGTTAGALARFVLPSKRIVSVWALAAAGLIGSITGGLVSAAIYAFNPLQTGYHPTGLLMSAAGALVVLESFVSHSRRVAYARRTVL